MTSIRDHSFHLDSPGHVSGSQTFSVTVPPTEFSSARSTPELNSHLHLISRSIVTADWVCEVRIRRREQRVPKGKSAL